MTFGPAVFRHHVFTLDEAGFAQTLVNWVAAQVARVRGRRKETEVTGPNLGELFDLSPEHIEASADNFFDIFGDEAVRRFFSVLQRRFAPKPEPERPVDPAFAKSLAKPRRPRKATKAAPQPKEPASV
jgi:hypothetical protein